MSLAVESFGPESPFEGDHTVPADLALWTLVRPRTAAGEGPLAKRVREALANGTCFTPGAMPGTPIRRSAAKSSDSHTSQQTSRSEQPTGSGSTLALPGALSVLAPVMLTMTNTRLLAQFTALLIALLAVPLLVMGWAGTGVWDSGQVHTQPKDHFSFTSPNTRPTTAHPALLPLASGEVTVAGDTDQTVRAYRVELVRALTEADRL